MAKENVKKFYGELAANKQLHGKLQKALEEYDGNKEDRNSVVEEVFIPVAKEAGYEFTAEEIRSYEEETMAERGISEEELENVSGGAGAKGLCLIIGGYAGTAADVDCFSLCCFVGIGFGSRF